MVSSSRGITYASQGADFADAARAKVLALKATVNAARG